MSDTWSRSCVIERTLRETVFKSFTRQQTKQINSKYGGYKLCLALVWREQMLENYCPGSQLKGQLFKKEIGNVPQKECNEKSIKVLKCIFFENIHNLIFIAEETALNHFCVKILHFRYQSVHFPLLILPACCPYFFLFFLCCVQY